VQLRPLQIDLIPAKVTDLADLSDLISPAVRYSRGRTSMFLGLFGGSGRDGVVFFLEDSSSALFLTAVFGFAERAAEDFTADFAFFETVLGMIAENDHW
jgi:hypothetical protein